MLNSLPKTSTRIFPTTYDSMNMGFWYVRKKAARNLQNPRLPMVSSKSVLSSMKYIHTLYFKDDEFEVATPTDIGEAKKYWNQAMSM